MIDVAIFSYNRPAYLKNCVDSVQRNIPGARIRVFDDNSDDPETTAYLASLGAIVVTADQAGPARHGGLYSNMQRAFESCSGTYLLMLQDDVQIVRPVDAQDLDDIDAIFASDARAAFVSVLFMRGRTLRRYRRQLVAQPQRGVYDAPGHQSLHKLLGRQAYFDISLWHVARLRQANWAVEDSESANIAKARALFSTMPTMKTPFVFFCLEVPFFRNRSQTWAARIARRRSAGAIKAFHDMSLLTLATFRARDMIEWPVAEDWLTPTAPHVRRPFVYKDVRASWWLNLLYRLERLWRK
jgi:glycosyltransferase involved in cell wall biosynthesis